MARTSRFEKPQPQVQWNAGLYIRLSREDGDRAESESVSSQKAIIERYLSEHGEITAADFYIDDGWSGTDFERPSFKRMFTDVTDRRINCVIVKDLSRFGRNYIEAGKYLEAVFPLLNVRFIAINDGIDNVGNPSSANSILLPFKNLLNDEYCRDISTKVRSSLTARRFQGKFIGAFAPYGYKKDSRDHNKLVVDAEAAEVVRAVFNMFLSGESIVGIANKLNFEGIDNPSSYKAKHGLNCKRRGGLWSDRTVRRMLSNRVYVGDMVQKKYEVVSYKIHVGRQTREDERIVVENTHEAIIDAEAFEKVQGLLARDTRLSPTCGKPSIFSGFLKCADCGRAMNKKSVTQPNKRYDYYVCSTFRRSFRGGCTKHAIRADFLENAVREALNGYISLAVNYEKLKKMIKSDGAEDTERARINKLIGEKRAEIKLMNARILDLYPDYKDGILSLEGYRALKEKYESALKKLEEDVKKLSDKLENDERERRDVSGFVDKLKKYGGFTSLTREIIIELVEDVFVGEGGEVEVRLKCRDALRDIKKAVESLPQSEGTEKLSVKYR